MARFAFNRTDLQNGSVIIIESIEVVSEDPVRMILIVSFGVFAVSLKAFDEAFCNIMTGHDLQYTSDLQL